MMASFVNLNSTFDRIQILHNPTKIWESSLKALEQEGKFLISILCIKNPLPLLLVQYHRYHDGFLSFLFTTMVIVWRSRSFFQTP